MDLYYIDYVSVSNRSWLHRLPVAVKMPALVVIIAVLLWLRYALLDAVLVGLVLVLALTARVPMKIFLPLMLYPVVFLLVLFLSVNGLRLSAILLIGFRAFAIAGSVVLFLLTTSFPAIFGALSRVLPGPLVAALFFTYRALFIISDSITNVRTGLHLRGGIDWKRPIFSVHNFGMILGHLLVDSIDTSERMADGLRIRGFQNRIYHLGEGK